jgi:hypothetical protein
MDVKSLGLIVKHPFNKSNKIELFITDDTFTKEDAIELMNQLVKDHPLQSIKDCNAKIKELEYKCDNDKCVLVAKEKTKQEEARTKQEEAKTKREEAKTKRAEAEKEVRIEKEKTKQRQMDIEMKKLENTINDAKIEDTNIYLQFLNEKTKVSTTHIYCATLYASFKDWLNSDARIPSNKEFVTNLKKYKEILSVKVNGKAQLGIKFLQLK